LVDGHYTEADRQVVAKLAAVLLHKFKEMGIEFSDVERKRLIYRMMLLNSHVDSFTEVQLFETSMMTAVQSINVCAILQSDEGFSSAVMRFCDRKNSDFKILMKQVKETEYSWEPRFREFQAAVDEENQVDKAEIIKNTDERKPTIVAGEDHQNAAAKKTKKDARITIILALLAITGWALYLTFMV